MFLEELAVEHYRLHVMELWPEGPLKRAGIAAARSRLESLTRRIGNGTPFVCVTCGGNSLDVEKPSEQNSVTL